jgi:hypothetical protein
MPKLKLKINEHLVGLKQVGEFLFEAQNPNMLEFAISGSSPANYQICITTENCEKELESLIENIDKRMVSKKWILFIADNDSEDSTFSIAKKIKCSADSVAYLKFSKSNVPKSTYHRISKIADIYKKEYPFRVLFELMNPERHMKQIESFSCVATREMKEEALIMLWPLREIYHHPVYVLCDDETENYLSGQDLGDLKFKNDANPSVLKEIKEMLKDKIKNRNQFHRPECILKKMDVMDWALGENENTFFLDTDIIVIRDITDNLSEELILSPHYDISSRANNGIFHGYFNAGYIFCSDKTFPEHWKDLYLNRSQFYEQEGMNYISEKYDMGIFGEEHNIGFWRDTKLPKLKEGMFIDPLGFNIELPKEVKSFHSHLSPFLDYGPHTALQKKNEQMREMVLKYLESEKPELFYFIKEVFGE